MEKSELDLVSTGFNDKDYTPTSGVRWLQACLRCQSQKREGVGKTYKTVKDDQSVLLHPSTVLGVDSEWVVYNELCSRQKLCPHGDFC